MPGNTNPVYSRRGNQNAGQVQAAAIIGPSANTAQDGTGANMYSVWQADTINGGFIQKLVARAVGSPAATVMRVYISSITGAFTPGTTNTVSNTWLYTEITLPAQTLSQVAASIPFEVPLNMMLEIGYRIMVSFGTSTGAAGTGYSVVGVGGDY